MATITQDMRYRLSLIKYAERFGVTKAAIKYKTNRQYIYRWKRRYDGSIESLRDRSRRPHHHPNQHTPEEIKLIFDMCRRNPNAGLVVFWVKLKQRGYSRSIPGLYRFLRKQGIMAVHPPNPKYIPKPYEQMNYPGQRIQVDVKFVPSACLKNPKVIGKQFFQYCSAYSPFEVSGAEQVITLDGCIKGNYALTEDGIQHLKWIGCERKEYSEDDYKSDLSTFIKIAIENYS